MATDHGPRIRVLGYRLQSERTFSDEKLAFGIHYFARQVNLPANITLNARCPFVIHGCSFRYADFRAVRSNYIREAAFQAFEGK